MGVIQGSINNMIGSIGMIKKSMSFIERMEKANLKSLEIQKAKLKAKDNISNKRRSFKDYLNKMPTSLGGKVGDLPIDIQKTIAKKFNKYQRKKIMDIEDKRRI